MFNKQQTNTILRYLVCTLTYKYRSMGKYLDSDPRRSQNCLRYCLTRIKASYGALSYMKPLCIWVPYTPTCAHSNLAIVWLVVWSFTCHCRWFKSISHYLHCLDNERTLRKRYVRGSRKLINKNKIIKTDKRNRNKLKCVPEWTDVICWWLYEYYKNYMVNKLFRIFSLIVDNHCLHIQ